MKIQRSWSPAKAGACTSEALPFRAGNVQKTLNPWGLPQRRPGRAWKCNPACAGELQETDAVFRPAISGLR